MVEIPSPAIAVVGRKNSGKTTLVVGLIEELVARGVDVASVKHHHHPDFEIDVPGKDSYRHRRAGASETVVAAAGQIARVKTVRDELTCEEIVLSMPGHDIVIVEGYRKSSLPSIEIMRAGNAADEAAAQAFAQGARTGKPLDATINGGSYGDAVACEGFSTNKMPAASTVAIVTDIPAAMEAAAVYGIPVFALDDIAQLATFLEERYVRPKITVAIQAGGESRRMGQSKALVPFLGRPLICRLVERLAPVADELLITTNEGDKLAFLDREYPDLSIRLVPDLHDFRGALPGVHTALDAASNPFVALVACDMVNASPRLIVAEAIAMRNEHADVVVPVNKHGFEPFHAIYRRSTCLPVVVDALNVGDKRVRTLYEKVKTRGFTQAEVLAAEPMGGCFVNANTPDELHKLEERYLES